MRPYKHTTCIPRRFNVEYKCVFVGISFAEIVNSFGQNLHFFFLLECQDTPCSKQARYLKFKWLQLGWDPKPFNS